MMMMMMMIMMVMMMMVYDNIYLLQLLTIEVFWGWNQLRITAFPENGDNHPKGH